MAIKSQVVSLLNVKECPKSTLLSPGPVPCFRKDANFCAFFRGGLVPPFLFHGLPDAVLPLITCPWHKPINPDYTINAFLNPCMQRLSETVTDLEHCLKMSFKSKGLQACRGEKPLYWIAFCKCGQLQTEKSSLARLKLSVISCIHSFNL